MNLSVVIPLFNEAESLPELINWIDQVMNRNSFSYEIILIDDGSTDNSWDIILEEKKKNSKDRKKILLNKKATLYKFCIVCLMIESYEWFLDMFNSKILQKGLSPD